MAAHFTPDMQNLKQSSFSYIDQNMEIVSQFPQLDPSDVEIPGLDFQGLLGFSCDNFLPPGPEFPGNLAGPEFPGNLADAFPGLFSHESRTVLPPTEPVTSAENLTREGKKRKSVETPESSSVNSSSPASGNGIRRKKASGRGKRAKSNDKEGEKQREVVHVRAKRGQATDSHSLAERLRRGKINERLKCLQSIVPGCYKTMGMAVMLDEIINYVQSLQNQVEFLSMKLTAASSYHEFNSEMDIMQTMQRAKAYEAMMMQKLVREGCEGQLGQRDLNFGCYPSLPYSR